MRGRQRKGQEREAMRAARDISPLKPEGSHWLLLLGRGDRPKPFWLSSRR